MRKTWMLAIVSGLILVSGCGSEESRGANCTDNPNDPECQKNVNDPKTTQCTNPGEKYDGTKCVCDTDGKWTGTAGNCTCESGYAQNGNSCIPESDVGKCPNPGEVYDGSSCVCDTNNYWTGTPGSCSCASGYKLDGNSCTKIQCNKGEIPLADTCACDTANHWTGDVGSCSCVTGYEEQDGVCKSLCGKGETMSGSSCVCDTNGHWEGTQGNCTCIEGYSETNGKCLEVITNAGNCLNLEEPAVGKICLFGKYMQTAAGTDMTDLEWQILKLGDDNSFMMISKRVIDVKPYYKDNDTDVTWAQSTMRSWLNGFGAAENLAGTDYTNDNFIQKAFNETEREHIQQVTNTNPAGPMGVSGGEDTQERVFLLNVNEVKQYFPTAESREALTTEYAKNLNPKVLYEPDGCSGDECKAFWLTRTPGDNLKRIIRIFSNGFICPHGTSLYYTVHTFSFDMGGHTQTYEVIVPSEHGVRPVIWVKK